MLTTCVAGKVSAEGGGEVAGSADPLGAGGLGPVALPYGVARRVRSSNSSFRALEDEPRDKGIDAQHKPKMK